MVSENTRSSDIPSLPSQAHVADLGTIYSYSFNPELKKEDADVLARIVSDVVGRNLAEKSASPVWRGRSLPASNTVGFAMKAALAVRADGTSTALYGGVDLHIPKNIPADTVQLLMSAINNSGIARIALSSETYQIPPEDTRPQVKLQPGQQLVPFVEGHPDVGLLRAGFKIIDTERDRLIRTIQIKPGYPINDVDGVVDFLSYLAAKPSEYVNVER